MAELTNSLVKGLQILKTFTPEHPTLRLIDIVNLTSLPKTTVIRILKTLTALHYVRFDESKKAYHLGPEVMSLGYTVLDSLDIREKAVPYLEELSRLTQSNVHCAILNRANLIIVIQIKKRSSFSIDRPVGSHLNAYRTAIGKALLAFLPPDKLQETITEILNENDSATFIGENGEILMQELNQVRERGYSLSDQELYPGILAIGAPIFNSIGVAEAAINITTLNHQFNKKTLIKKYMPLLLNAAKMISSANGYRI